MVNQSPPEHLKKGQILRILWPTKTSSTLFTSTKFSFSSPFTGPNKHDNPTLPLLKCTYSIAWKPKVGIHNLSPLIFNKQIVDLHKTCIKVLVEFLKN